MRATGRAFHGERRLSLKFGRKESANKMEKKGRTRGWSVRDGELGSGSGLNTRTLGSHFPSCFCLTPLTRLPFVSLLPHPRGNLTPPHPPATPPTFYKLRRQKGSFSRIIKPQRQQLLPGNWSGLPWESPLVWEGRRMETGRDSEMPRRQESELRHSWHWFLWPCTACHRSLIFNFPS